MKLAIKIRSVIPVLVPALVIVLVLPVSAQEQPPVPDAPSTELPGDQYEPVQLPGDQYEPAQLPGDQYEPTQLPGDQYDPAQLPGDQYDTDSLSGDSGGTTRPPGTGNRLPNAATPELLLHLPLDGSPAVRGGTGQGTFYRAQGYDAPTTVDGVVGQALLFEGKALVATPFNLDHARYPQVTVTAWIREPAGAQGTRAILSAGSGLRFSNGGGTLAIVAGQTGIHFSKGDIPKDQWVFVAGFVDVQAGRARLQQDDVYQDVVAKNTSTSPPRVYADPDDESAEDQPYVFIGANDFRTWGATARPLAIDDVRVYAGALSAEQIAGLRNAATTAVARPVTASNLSSSSSGATMIQPGTPAGATPDGTLANSDLLPTGCQGHGDCAEGQYCAIEKICHPDQHAPMQASEIPLVPIQSLPTRPQETSSSGTPRPVGPAYLTGVSGEAGKPTYTMDLSNKFLTGITWWEKSDRPCGIRIEGGADSDSELTKEFYNCGKMLGGSLLSDSSGLVSLPTTGMTASFAGRGVGALQVCSNTNRNRRMKGLRISGDWIGVDGSIQGSDLEDQYELPNCSEWRTTVSCGLTRLATGLVVHITRASGYDEQIVGLQLICREVALEDR